MEVKSNIIAERASEEQIEPIAGEVLRPFVVAQNAD